MNKISDNTKYGLILVLCVLSLIFFRSSFHFQSLISAPFTVTSLESDEDFELKFPAPDKPGLSYAEKKEK